MLHSAPPLEVGASSTGHHRCLLRDVGGHGALLPADSSRLYGDDAATTKFLLERILRGSGIPPLPYSSSSSSSSAAAVHAEQREDPEVSASRFVPKSQVHGDDTSEASGAGAAPATALYRPVESAASSPASFSADAEPAERGDSAPPASGFVASAQHRGDGTSEPRGSGTPTATELHGPLESTACPPVSGLADILGSDARILIVANRLPVTAKRNEENSWDLDVSPGGLVSALQGVTRVQMMWVGWPGVSVPDKKDQMLITDKLKEKRCIPVFLDEEVVDQYYSGYCNNILWPLFHYMGLPQDYKFKKAKDFKSQLEAYEKANQMFANTVDSIYEEGDIVWCHDYHLMMLPRFLKRIHSNMKVGWFLHTPFPSSELYRALPNRQDLLEAVLESDLIGFHTYDYARHFVSACTSLLGLESYLEGVEFNGRIVKIEAFPIGIDCSKFKQALELPGVKEKMDEFRRIFADRKVMLGVDRFDMIKGLLQKVLAFEKYLEENMDMKEKVVLLQIAVPTRSEVPEYQKLASQVHELVARVNGRFGTLRTTPIHHLDQSLDFQTLCALYAVTDVALVTSLRDGMNLVSYEYVACQELNKGVLILSEFAGAAQSLGAGAIVVNPWNVEEVAKSIKDALAMSADKREEWHKHNYKLVSAHSAQGWAEDYVCELHNTGRATKALLQTKQPSVALPIEKAASRYGQSRNRLLILGFNETLTEQVQSLERGATVQTENMKLKLNPELKGPLKTLCSNENTTVIVVSGYGKEVLDENFKEFKMWLSAENGMFLRHTGEQWIATTTEYLDIGCSDSVKKLIKYFTTRTPNSYQEQRETSFVWNYKYADGFGRNQAKDMLRHLGAYSSSNRTADVIEGRRSIEVRPVGVTKGNAVTEIIEELGCKEKITTPIDYVLCIGHFLAKDEDVYTLPYFATQPESKRKAKGQTNRKSIEFDLKAENYFPCTVGRERSLAKYKLEGTSRVVSLLGHLAQMLSSSEEAVDTVEHDGSQL
uniref:Uncharacterized protein n=1 Tax=Avena sativa TaxID=4498 RepID=A0ACD5TY49_AVESA